MVSFTDFARAHGLRVDSPIPDGRWHRVRTESKPRKFNGAYLWDGTRGVVRDWATMESYAAYRPEGVAPVDRAVVRRSMQESRKAEVERHARVALEAQRLVAAATWIQPAPAVAWRPWSPGRDEVMGHPYLVRKGLPLAGFLSSGSHLLVPMWAEGQIVNVQRIDADGAKRFLPGGRAKGATYRIGPPKAREVWLVEGYATGLSLTAALRSLYRANAAVVICFSADNLRRVRGTHVMADNDASGAGESAARATGLPWVMPPAVGMDANDLHVRDGLRAVCDLVRSCAMT